MFNRTTKLTAVLLAAASVISTVPAMASTRLANKDGNIDHAVAFKDGKYLYQGYRTDDEDNGIYFNSGDKDKKLDDIDALVQDDDDSVAKFDDKYVTAYDGSKEYVVDITSGKVSEDDLFSDVKDTAENKVQNRLKKTDRYSKDAGNGENATVTGSVAGTAFSKSWFEYEATTMGGSKGFGYTDVSGNYIDCSYNQNIYAYTGSKMIKLENVGDEEDGITLNSVERIKTLGQDEKYIYSVIKADLSGAKAVNKNGDVSTAYYVQKVTKAQGDKEKDAYLPKSTETYEIADEAVLGNGDVKTAYQVLLADTDEGVNDFTGKNMQYNFVDGAIYGTFNDSDTKVKTFKIVLKTSEKLDRYDSENKKLSTKVGAHVAKKDGDKDSDIIAKNAWDVDVNGTVWALDKGVIKKSTKCGDFETVYTCDRSLNAIDVYDENNLIAWDTTGDVYTTVTEGSAEAKKEAEEVAGTDKKDDQQQQQPVVKTGWQAEGNTWYLYSAAGVKLTGWQAVNGTWYYMDATGAMKTGWQSVGGNWYYMDANGAMKTGWQLVNGKWYFMYDNGSMAANTTVGGYVVGADGAWIQ